MDEKENNTFLCGEKVSCCLMRKKRVLDAEKKSLFVLCVVWIRHRIYLYEPREGVVLAPVYLVVGLMPNCGQIRGYTCFLSQKRWEKLMSGALQIVRLAC